MDQKNKIPGLRLLDSDDTTTTKSTNSVTANSKPFVGQALLDALDNSDGWKAKSKRPNRSDEAVASTNSKREEHGKPNHLNIASERYPIRSKKAGKSSDARNFSANQSHDRSQQSQESGTNTSRNVQQHQHGPQSLRKSFHSKRQHIQSHDWRSTNSPAPSTSTQSKSLIHDHEDDSGAQLSPAGTTPLPAPYSSSFSVANSSPLPPDQEANELVQSELVEQLLRSGLLDNTGQASIPARDSGLTAQSPEWLQPLKKMVQKYQAQDFSANSNLPAAPQKAVESSVGSLLGKNKAFAYRKASPKPQSPDKQAMSQAYKSVVAQQAKVIQAGASTNTDTKGRWESKARRNSIDDKIALPIPMPNVNYLLQASQPPRLRSNESMPLLIILDLNGTLVHRNRTTTTIKLRPHVREFMAHILNNHYVMIWSSAREENVNRMVSHILKPADRHRLVAEWNRSHLGLNEAQMNQKVQVYKQLSWVWNSPSAYTKYPACRWNQSNTVLIDDTILKASAEPCNLVEVPEWKGEVERNNALGQVIAYLDWLSWHENVSCAIKSKPFKIDTEWRWNWNSAG